ncbi:hypothetical protein WCD74_15570 [Actinomycetospora sp. OC33-EN08]|uniref:Integral membrane protein n=1 Tax=Actinomycetospora aurantiaca TaxID=3129233 RepID=A0ABU8MPD3_9PSEU
MTERHPATVDRFPQEPVMTTFRTTTSHVPAPARTDVAPPAPVPPDRHPSSGTLRLLGAGLAAGAGAYGVAFMTSGAESEQGTFAISLTGLFFQLGVFCLLAAMWRTRATGTTRLARAMLVVEAVVLGIATVQSVFTLPANGGEWGTVATVLDPFWPLSMLGMAVIGVKVAVAGRWRGALRVWPVVAETWIFVALPSLMVFGREIGSVVAGAHFLVGYAALGVLLAMRPDLTRR